MAWQDVMLIRKSVCEAAEHEILANLNWRGQKEAYFLQITLAPSSSKKNGGRDYGIILTPPQNAISNFYGVGKNIAEIFNHLKLWTDKTFQILVATTMTIW